MMHPLLSLLFNPFKSAYYKPTEPPPPQLICYLDYTSQISWFFWLRFIMLLFLPTLLWRRLSKRSPTLAYYVVLSLVVPMARFVHLNHRKMHLCLNVTKLSAPAHNLWNSWNSLELSSQCTILVVLWILCGVVLWVGDQVPSLSSKWFLVEREIIEESLQCAICLDLLRQPYVTSCGHLFDLQCLRSWFRDAPPSDLDRTLNTNHPAYNCLRTKTCPLCQAVITTPPSPMFALGPILDAMRRSDFHEDATPIVSAKEPWRDIFLRPAARIYLVHGR
ncbi:hypothetical protein C8R43DRAFT_978365 [Mycena crocata]|nr:hypothetical protein C8R43DRAFT_978365 [Mycena crocata]